MKLMQLGKALN